MSRRPPVRSPRRGTRRNTRLATPFEPRAGPSGGDRALDRTRRRARRSGGGRRHPAPGALRSAGCPGTSARASPERAPGPRRAHWRWAGSRRSWSAGGSPGSTPHRATRCRRLGLGPPGRRRARRGTNRRRVPRRTRSREPFLPPRRRWRSRCGGCAPEDSRTSPGSVSAARSRAEGRHFRSREEDRMECRQVAVGRGAKLHDPRRYVSAAWRESRS